MANIKQQKKRVLTDEKRRSRNFIFKSSLKTAIKKVELAVQANDAASAQEALRTAHLKLDKGLSKGLHHKNYVARQKARLQNLVNSL